MMNRFSRRVAGHGLWAVAAFIALCGITSSAFAQVVYERAIPVPDPQEGSFPPQFLSISQAPYVTGNPAITYELPPIIFPSALSAQYNTLDQARGIYSFPDIYPTDVKLINNSRAAWLGQDSTDSGSTLIAITIFKQILTYDSRSATVTSFPSLSIEYGITNSIAVRSLNDPVSLIGDSQHYTVDRLTGVMTPEPLAGVDTATTRFMSYGANGLLYVLDYGNDRIASFDPDNAFAPVNSFTLESDVTTANEQFAIGINGNFYLGDGLGGGSDYNSQGQFQGVFTLPTDATTSTYAGASYLTTGADGSVFVYDKNYGFQEYQDVSAVPKPSTTALLILGGLGAFLLRRRWSRALVIFMALCGITSSAFAQVVYERTIPVPIGTARVLQITQAPYVTSDPATTNEIPLLITVSSQFYNLDQTAGVYGFPYSYPGDVKLINNSKLAWLGQNSADSGSTLIAITIFKQILTYDSRSATVTSFPSLSIEYELTDSIAVRSLNDPVSLMADLQHYTVDRLTGVMTPEPLAGVDTTTTQFMSYGANGLLYVLDYGNNRIASFDPDNAFAPVSSFNFESGVTTANEQFAIGINGDFYLGDGLGGGSYYNSQGDFQGVFALPADATTSTYAGASYVMTEADGSVFVYDKNYGFQEYQDVSAVPEPSTWILVITALLGMLLFNRHWQRA